jgi:type II secretory pathway pseudopilin PulG
MENHEPIIEPKNKSNKGLVATLVILIILAIAAVGGTWYFMNNKAKKDKKVQEEQIQQLQKQIDDLKSQAATKITTAQTKSYTTKYDKLKFNYPSNWTLTDTSEAHPESYVKETGLPGLDVVTLKSPDGFEIELKDGMYGIGGSCEAFSTLANDKLNILGKDYLLNYEATSNTTSPVFVVVSSDPRDCIGKIDSKNLIVNNGQPSALIIYAGYGKGSSQTYADLKNDPNVQELKKFLQSLSY